MSNISNISNTTKLTPQIWCELPTKIGKFRMYDSGCESLSIISYGDLHQQGNHPLIRIHSSCRASEVFGAQDCDCADQLRESMKKMATEEEGIIFYLQQEGRGHGLSTKIKAVSTMNHDQIDTVEAYEKMGLEQDIRCYQPVIKILASLNVKQIRLITNNPRKINALISHGLSVTMVNTNPSIRAENVDYLHTKKNKLGHLLKCDDTELQSLQSLQSLSAIHFYHSDQAWGFFSNFSNHSIFMDGLIWPTVEHYYQAQKFKGTRWEETIRCAESAMVAKKIAIENFEVTQQDKWDQMKESVMLAALRAKFNQHPDLRLKLQKTGALSIVEQTKKDHYWGDGGNGLGLNRLGILLMQVRHELCLES